VGPILALIAPSPLLKDILRHKYIINHTGTIRGIASVVTKNIPKESCENDFILNHESKFTLIYEDYKTDKNILKRPSRDTQIDQRGKELLDLCISNQSVFRRHRWIISNTDE
jgi:hypothetical protein